MSDTATLPPQAALTPALEMAAASKSRWSGESAGYREARTALLAEEIALRRQIQRVAERRRALPPGPAARDYRFRDEQGREIGLTELFGEHPTLFTYFWMFGPERERPCPMCTSLLSAWDGEARDVDQRTSLVVIARSPIERLVAFKKERGWRNLRLYSDPTQEFSRDYFAITPDGGDTAAFNVFTRRDGTIRHFWAGEMGGESADPGQDPRGAPDLMPLWTILDCLPEGRGTDWYPKLDYPR